MYSVVRRRAFVFLVLTDSRRSTVRRSISFADFSRSWLTPEESVAAAIDTLARWPTHLLVELVVSDE